MKKSEIITTVILVLLTVAIVVAVVICAVYNSKNNDVNNGSETETPVVTPSDDITTEPDIPVIDPPSIPDDTDEPDKQELPGDVHVDIIDANTGNEKDNEPHIVGEPSVHPGVKENDNEENN